MTGYRAGMDGEAIFFTGQGGAGRGKAKNLSIYLLSLAYPIDRLDWALFSVVILFHHFFPLLEKVEIRVFILPRNFPAVLIIFTGRGGAGNPPLPTARGGRGTPPSPRGGFPAGRGVHPWFLCGLELQLTLIKIKVLYFVPEHLSERATMKTIYQQTKCSVLHN